MTRLDSSNRTRMPVSTGRDSSRLAARLTRDFWSSPLNPAKDSDLGRRLYANADVFANLTKRYAFYDEAEKIVVADAPWVFLYYPVTYIIRQPWVNDYVINPMRPTRFEHIWLSPHTQ